MTSFKEEKTNVFHILNKKRGGGKKSFCLCLKEMESSLDELSRKIPYLTVNAGPRDGPKWITRLKEEYTSLIKYISMNKESGDDWFTLEAVDKLGTK